MGAHPVEAEIRSQRARLLARDQTLAAELGRVYGMVFRRLTRTYDDLERAIAAEVAKGRTPAVSWIVRLEQHKKLLAEIEAEIYAYGKQATEIISNGQHSVLSVVNANQASLTVLAAGAAPEYALTVIREGFIGLNADALRHFVGRASDGSPLDELFKDLPGRSTQKIKDQLAYDIATGKGPKVAARNFRDVAKVPLQRATTIARTETMKAYNAASLETFKQSPVVQGWTWGASLDDRTCSACWAMAGTVHTNEESLNGHVNDRCTMIPKTLSWDELGFKGIEDTQYKPPLGSDVFKGLSEARQREILGPGKYDLYKDGMPLDQFAKTHTSDKWGDSIRQATVTELKAAA